MDRYKEEKDYYQTSRSNKNQDLYQNLGSNVRYANFSDVANANAYELTDAKEKYQTREGYQKYRDYQDMIPAAPLRKELDEFNHVYQEHSNKIYDINSVLESARENRVDKLDEKRKLKNEDYNIFSKTNKKELEQFRRERTQKEIRPDNELREFIDTITSKTLAGEIDKDTTVDLLSDLMATNMMDKVEPQKQSADSEQLKDIDDKEQKVNESTNFKDADTDFYTRSMDLSEKDFNFDDDSKEKKLPLALKIFLFLLIVVVTIVAAYFIYSYI